MSRSSITFFFLFSLFSFLILLSCEQNLTDSAVSPAVESVSSYVSGTATIYEGQQPGGAVFKIWAPDEWNGDLVLFAHGYVSILEPVAIPENQLYLPDGTHIPTLVNDLGFAFAVSSYRGNGLIVEDAIMDLEELVTIFNTAVAKPVHTYLIGASEGGLITIKSIERHASLYSGGLALCGPVGDFQAQIGYFLNFRVVFDYFFPDVLPGSPVSIPDEVMNNWDTVYQPAVIQAIAENPEQTRELLRVTGAAFDPDVPETAAETVLGLLWYNVFATNDALSKFGGLPYDNSRTVYRGSSNDRALNAGVQRFTADPVAVRTLEAFYQSTGDPLAPIVTMHTIGDPIVPAWHEPQYRMKVRANNKSPLHSNYLLRKYGHCNFEQDEVLLAFRRLIIKVEAAGIIAKQKTRPVPVLN